MYRGPHEGDGSASELTVTPLKEKYWGGGHDSHSHSQLQADEEDLLFTSETTARGFTGLSPNSHARYSPTKANAESRPEDRGVHDGELEARLKQIELKGAAAMQLDDPESRGNLSKKPPESALTSARSMARKLSAGHATTDAARLIALEEECRALNQQLHSQEKGLIQLTAESEKSKKTILALQQRVEKEQASSAELANKLKLAESQLALAKKEVAVLQRQAAKATATVGSASGGGKEAKAQNVWKEENDKLRVEVDRLRAAVDGAVPSSATNTASGQVQHLITENKKLEAQRMELLACVRKQNKLIDILKRQKMHLEASRLLEISEEEFTKAMEHPLPRGAG